MKRTRSCRRERRYSHQLFGPRQPINPAGELCLSCDRAAATCGPHRAEGRRRRRGPSHCPMGQGCADADAAGVPYRSTRQVIGILETAPNAKGQRELTPTGLGLASLVIVHTVLAAKSRRRHGRRPGSGTQPEAFPHTILPTYQLHPVMDPRHSRHRYASWTEKHLFQHETRDSCMSSYLTHRVC